LANQQQKERQKLGKGASITKKSNLKGAIE
jgi:hypothetical protein